LSFSSAALCSFCGVTALLARQAFLEARVIEISWHPTYRCNLACLHCKNSGRSAGEELDFQLARKVLRDLSSCVDRVTFSGGEPFVWDCFISLLEEVALSRFGIEVKTNGTCITKSIADRLRPLDIEVIQVSLDGATRATHDSIRGTGAFDAALRGLDLLRAAGKEVALSFTPMKVNQHEIVDFCALASSLGISQVRFPLFCLTGAARENAEMLELSFKDTTIVYQTILECAERYGLSFGGRAERRPRSLGEMPRIKPNCGVGWSPLIDPKGDIYPCANMVYPGFVCGNVKTDCFYDVFQFSKTLQEMRSLTEVDVLSCDGCSYTDLCLGGCRAKAFELAGSLTATDPNCQFYKWYCGMVMSAIHRNSQRRDCG
jgi:radical SAM protein with 4Fe4S-binding SPASM domain